MPSLSAAYAQALARWLGDPVLRLAGVPFIAECYRSPERQDELYKQGRSKPGPIVTYKRGGESKHNRLPCFGRGVSAAGWVGVVVGAAAEQVCAAGEGGRCAGAVGRRLAGI